LSANGARLNLVNRSDRSGLRAEVILPRRAELRHQAGGTTEPELEIGFATTAS
jgi:hypothetical protein